LEKYFNSDKGSEFIEAVRLHLQQDFLDFPGAAVAGVNKAFENNSITEFVIALALDGTPLVIALIRYLDALNKRNKKD
jgi:hypothetical protein